MAAIRYHVRAPSLTPSHLLPPSNAPVTNAQFLQDANHDISRKYMSRRGANPSRYADGRLRPDRPLPPGFSPRKLAPLTQLSPRFQRNGGAYEWDSSVSHMVETTSQACFRPPAVRAAVPPTRLGLSPRHMKSQVGSIIFSDPNFMTFTPRDGVYVPRHLPPLIPVPAQSETTTAAPPAKADLSFTDEQRIALLEVALRHERRMTEAARARQG